MAAKYHVNPQTGIPGPCTASAGRCPFGGENDHYSNPADAVRAYEDSFVSSVPQAAVKPIGNPAQELAALAKKIRAAREDRDRVQRSERDIWLAAHQSYLDAVRERDQLISDLEDRGLGHAIPDQGKTLRVATKAQKILMEEHIKGQLSDGMWENTKPYDHWKSWTEATVIVDPKNLGKNFYAMKDGYRLNSSELVSIVGGEMVDSVRAAGVGNYDEKKLRNDLAGLSANFKKNRPNHEGDEAAEPKPGTPVAKRVGTRQQAAVAQATGRKASTSLTNNGNHSDMKTMVARVMSSKGTALSESTYYGIHSGMANPMTGEGDDYGHVAPGGVVILGQADGKRARVVAGGGEFFDDPESELGRPAKIWKQQNSGRDSLTDDLHVLGYRDMQGNVYGWMPDKKIGYFVAK